MSQIPRGTKQAMAARLAVTVEQYDRQCAEMVRTWLDLERYAAVSALVDEMRPWCERLPRLSLPWAAFLISHSELVFILWRAGSASSCSPEVQACVSHHSVALRALRQGCALLCEADQGHGPSSLACGSAPPP